MKVTFSWSYDWSVHYLAKVLNSFDELASSQLHCFHKLSQVDINLLSIVASQGDASTHLFVGLWRVAVVPLWVQVSDSSTQALKNGHNGVKTTHVSETTTLQ